MLFPHVSHELIQYHYPCLNNKGAHDPHSKQMGPGMESSGLLDLFRERVDYTVEASGFLQSSRGGEATFDVCNGNLPWDTTRVIKLPILEEF